MNADEERKEPRMTRMKLFLIRADSCPSSLPIFIRVHLRSSAVSCTVGKRARARVRLRFSRRESAAGSDARVGCEPGQVREEAALSTLALCRRPPGRAPRRLF